MNELHHEFIEVYHEPDKKIYCLIRARTFNRHDLNRIIGNLTSSSENFTVHGFQHLDQMIGIEGEDMMSEADRIYKQSQRGSKKRN